jgi:hypothetical protein
VATAANQGYVARIDASRIHALIRKPFDIDAMLSAVLTCGANDEAHFLHGPGQTMF